VAYKRILPTTDPYHGWIIGFNATNLLELTKLRPSTQLPNATVADFGGNAAEGGPFGLGGQMACR